MTAPNSAIRQVASLILGRGASAILQALTLVTFARSISPQEFGFVSATLGVGIVLMGISDLGMTALVLRESARENYHRVVSALRLNVLATLMLGVTGISILLIFAISFEDDFYLMLPIAIAVSLEKFADARLGIALADGRTWTVSFGLLVRRAVALTVLVTLLLLNAQPVLAFAIGYMAGGVAAMSVALIAVRVPTDDDPASLRDVFRLGLPYWLNSLASQLRNLDTAIVAVLTGGAQAGLYAVASRVIGPLQLAVTAAASVALPAAARQHPSARRLMVRKLYGLSVVAGLGYLVVAVTATWWVPTLLGDAYRDAIVAVTVVTLGLIPLSFGEVAKATLQGWGSAGRVAQVSVVGGGLVVALVALGALSGGSVGAAFGFAITMMCQAVAWAVLIESRVGGV